MVILSVRTENDCIIFSLDSKPDIELISFIKRTYWNLFDYRLDIRYGCLYQIIVCIPVGIDCEYFKSTLIHIFNDLGIYTNDKTNNQLFLVFI
jgi:hypothetical protein